MSSKNSEFNKTGTIQNDNSNEKQPKVSSATLKRRAAGSPNMRQSTEQVQQATPPPNKSDQFKKEFKSIF